MPGIAPGIAVEIAPGTGIALPWDCPGIAGLALGLPWDCPGIALGLLWDCPGIALHHGIAARIALELPWERPALGWRSNFENLKTRLGTAFWGPGVQGSFGHPRGASPSLGEVPSRHPDEIYSPTKPSVAWRPVSWMGSF